MKKVRVNFEKGIVINELIIKVWLKRMFPKLELIDIEHIGDNEVFLHLNDGGE